MSYTGEVEAGGPPDVRDLPGLTITKVAVGPYDNNAYLLRCAATGRQLLVDAANEASRLLRLVGDAPLDRIVTTHRHQDHWEALAEVAAATGAPVTAHPFDAEALPVPVTAPVEHGDVITFGEVALEVVHLRGHTPGSIALLYDADGSASGQPHLFTGDSLFPGGVGNTWGDPTRFRSLLDDVEERVFARLPDSTWFYPGHGKDSTLGHERPALPEWRARGW
ncbi:MBL fold metallo-hydrolase [Actinomadura atramentaria]|uniref:MBL fold metallo-hydrolase n=1 Tax=Actinomadura atramentaria TaxID=1990 RepID=UPI000365918E|nr:MBL fold metallo-hydrolase [Actinomadura atramentaria]